jgi:hypothetical protein
MAIVPEKFVSGVVEAETEAEVADTRLVGVSAGFVAVEGKGVNA